MKASQYFPLRFRQLAFVAMVFVITNLHADQDLAGNVTVTGGASTGNLTVTGAIDSEGNTLTFGTQSSSFGAALLYQDSNADTFTFNTNRNPASWLWQHTTSIPAMRLDSAHQLILYQADGTTAGLTFSPASSSLKLGSVATLTGDGSGAITTSGAFTVGGAFTSSTGSLTGGVNGLSLNAGGTNQSITLNSSAAGDIIFNTNGVERARITSAGNVGIGASAPNYLLTLFSSAIPRVQLLNYLTGQNSTDGFQLYANGLDAVLLNKEAGNLYLGTDNAYRMTVGPTGNVGIGTTEPTQKLDVNGAASISGLLLASGDALIGNGTNRLYLRNLSGTNRIDSYNYPISGTVPLQLNASAISFQIADSEKVVINSSGKLIVGATASNPDLGEKLNVGGYAVLGSAAVPFLNWFHGNGGANAKWFRAGYNNGSFILESVNDAYTTPTTRLSIDTSGNVGIGTATPQKALSVEREVLINGNSSTGAEYNDWPIPSLSIRRSDDFVSNGITIASFGYSNDPIYLTDNSVANIRLWDLAQGASASVSANTTELKISSPGPISLGSGGTADRLYVNTAGNVGIGTASPQAALDVIKPGNANVYENGIRTNRPDSQGQYAFMGYGSVSSDAYFGSVYTGGGGVYGSIHLRQYTEGMVARDALNINSTGNVGIGASSPVGKLHVAATTGVSSPGSIALAIRDSNSPTYGFDFNLEGVSTGDLSLMRTVAGSQSQMMVFQRSTGNVGIGTTTPTAKLAVNGTIRAKEVIVDTGWADYVFDENYRLAPLSEVESHIRAEKHLPGIPSAAEVAEHGVSMGDMQARLLSKVEELTLHLIAQEKRNNTQQAEIATLRAELVQMKAAYTR